MEQPRKDSTFQNLKGDASLEKAKGVDVEAPNIKNEEKKGHGDQNQPTVEATAEVQLLQDDTELQAICSAFSGLQLSELERIFHRTQFPNVFGRKELGTSVNAEAEAEPCEPEEASS